MSSDTPETDAVVKIYRYPEYHVGATLYVSEDFARNLERQRNELCQLARELRDVILGLEYSGNEKETRCPCCGSHCSATHDADCKIGKALTKATKLLP